MSALPQKPIADPKKIEKLLREYSGSEAYDILAARIILANERIRDTSPPSRVLTDSRKMTITEQDLHDITTGRFGRNQLPSEEEARYWLKKWRDGAKPKQEPPTQKIMIERHRPEVRE